MKKYGKYFLRYYDPFLWSKLTQELRTEDSLHRFKTKIIENGCRNCMLCNN